MANLDFPVLGLKQLENAKLHGIVLELGLQSDLLCQGKYDPPVVFALPTRSEKTVAC